MSILTQLSALGLKLPPPAPRGGLYQPVLQQGTLLYVSGQGPTREGVPVLTGRLGSLTIAEGQEAARICALNALSAVQAYLGDLDRLERVVKILGFVASDDDFHEQPQVINGCSELLRDLLGETRGVGARSAIGVNALPGNIPVEIEFVFEVRDD